MSQKELEEVVSLRQSGDLKSARIACGKWLAREPDDPSAMRQLAIIATDEGQLPEAERLLHRIAELDPDSAEAFSDLARFYAGKRDLVTAVEWFRRALVLAPSDVDLLLGIAEGLMIIGQVEEAVEAFDRCLKIEPQNAKAALGYGHVMRMLGKRDEAVQTYRKCLQSEATFADACWSLASLRGYQFADDEVELMLADNDDSSKPALDFAIARVMDNRGEYPSAWQYYIRGNKKQKEIAGFDSRSFNSRVDWVLETFTKEVCMQRSRSPHQDATPIFVVGMPRSGSTLIEQILASHSEVEGTGELPYLNDIALGLTTRSITGLGFEQLGTRYLDATRVHRSECKRYFVDKLPDNYLHVGLVHLMLPQAIVIDSRRDPLDNCVANFRQLYAAGKSYSYDLGEMAGVYQGYLKVMDHWDEVVPGKVLRIRYEDLVYDTERQVRRMLDHCELTWEPACLEFYKTERAVVTASSEQVREPIFQDSIGYWRRYQEESGLQGLMEALQHVRDG